MDTDMGDSEDYANANANAIPTAGYFDYNNSSENETGAYSNYTTVIQVDIISHVAVQTVFALIYATIFILGIWGNLLVCYVVWRNRAMQTVTNFFITNLAMADILLCSLAVPFTPLYTFLQEWIFGALLCHLVAYAQGTSVYISSLTLTSIAIDRYFVIMFPFKPRMKIGTCLLIICSIWLIALLATLPYGIFLHYTHQNNIRVCQEAWPSEEWRQGFSGFTAIMQFILPFLIISFCYIRVSFKLSLRAKFKPGRGVKNSKKEALERERKRRTNRMLIAMVAIFGISWLPLSLVNLLNDVSPRVDEWEYYNLCFFAAHAVAMSSSCSSVLLYSWLNENFRKEFKQILPCFTYPPVAGQRGARGEGGGSTRTRCLSEKTCNGNGNETVEESMCPSVVGCGFQTQIPLRILDTIQEQGSTTSSGEPGGSGSTGMPMPLAVAVVSSGVNFSSNINQVEIHVPGPGTLDLEVAAVEERKTP